MYVHIMNVCYVLDHVYIYVFRSHFKVIHPLEQNDRKRK